LRRRPQTEGGNIAKTRAIFGRSYAAEPDVLIEQLAKDEAIAEADTLLLTAPNQLVNCNAHRGDPNPRRACPWLALRQPKLRFRLQMRQYDYRCNGLLSACNPTETEAV
jgi:hypothetical protein